MVKITQNDIKQALNDIKPSDVIKMLPDTHFLTKSNNKKERVEAASYLVFKNLLKTTANIQQAKAVSKYVYQVFINMSEYDWELFDSFDDESRLEILGEVVKRGLQGYQAYIYKKHGIIPESKSDKKQESETDQMAKMAELVERLIKLREGK